jgi:biotin transport system substrate-specific component
MEIASAVNRTKYGVFRWRYELALPKKIALALGIACLIGVVAQVRFYVPWSPVPVTGQTFAVLLAGVVMGRRWGGISVALYAAIGAAGVPWFAPQAGMPAFSAGGIGHLTGATGGYIAGFVLAALFLGYFVDKYVKARRFVSMLGLMLFASLVLVYLPGLIWLGLWLNFISGTPASASAVIAMGAAPFIVGDVIKVVAAAALARAITPKTNYSRQPAG